VENVSSAESLESSATLISSHPDWHSQVVALSAVHNSLREGRMVERLSFSSTVFQSAMLVAPTVYLSEEKDEMKLLNCEEAAAEFVSDWRLGAALLAPLAANL